MTRQLAAACLLVALSGDVSSQTPTPAPQPPRGQMPDLGRPTKNEDTLPLFDFDAYFPGTWTFEWDMPDGPFGPAGRLEGTTVYSALGGGRYHAVTEATGPAGRVTIKEAITYQKDQKTLTREVTDSRGFSYSQKGTIGGDLGGLYYIYFESEPFTVNGTPVRVRHSLRLTAPLSYRLGVSVSESGGPFINNGNPWFRKQLK
jgi:hypothetical protein